MEAIYDGPVCRKVLRRAVELKALIRRGMSDETVEEATLHVNAILAEVDRLKTIETAAIVGAGSVDCTCRRNLAGA